jgi:hypothetical protein
MPSAIKLLNNQIPLSGERNNVPVWQDNPAHASQVPEAMKQIALDC